MVSDKLDAVRGGSNVGETVCVLDEETLRDSVLRVLESEAVAVGVGGSVAEGVRMRSSESVRVREAVSVRLRVRVPTVEMDAVSVRVRVYR